MGDDQTNASAAAERVKTLDRYGILDTAPESGFDDIVLLATRICKTPVALVSLVTDSRQWFKARIGFPPCETPLGQSVCAHALLQDGVFVIPDLTADARTRDNTLVTGEPFIRFYAGAPLRSPDGVPLGTLCVIDTAPRPEGLTATQADSLKLLAGQVMSQMELRRVLGARMAAEAASKRHQDMLAAELSHRLKNLLSIVQAIISQTLRSTSTLDDARTALSNRILALGRAQELLLAGSIEGASLATIIESAARLHHDGLERRFRIRGPEVEVGPKAALLLTLMVHELATNATKYGALSTPEGVVAVDWTLLPDGPEPQLVLVWRESAGPAVSVPTRRGFGTRLIERALASDLGGAVVLDYQPSGLECRLTAPLSGLQEA